MPVILYVAVRQWVWGQSFLNIGASGLKYIYLVQVIGSWCRLHFRLRALGSSAQLQHRRGQRLPTVISRQCHLQCYLQYFSDSAQQPPNCLSQTLILGRKDRSFTTDCYFEKCPVNLFHKAFYWLSCFTPCYFKWEHNAGVVSYLSSAYLEGKQWKLSSLTTKWKRKRWVQSYRNSTVHRKFSHIFLRSKSQLKRQKICDIYRAGNTSVCVKATQI